MMLVALTSTPTPSPQVGELVQQTEKVLDAFNSLGFGMAALFVMTLLSLVVLAIVWSNRNNSALVISTLAAVNTQKEKDIADLKAQRAIDHEQHIESLGALHDQALRQNDIQAEQAKILKTQTERDVARDLKTDQIAQDLKALSERGGQHAQEILSSAQRNAETLQRIDLRTASWDTIVQVVTPLLQELQALRVEAKRHSTKPIPVVEASENGAESEQRP